MNMPLDHKLKCLEELIARLGGADDVGKRSGGPCGLILEHLQAARRSLLGSMSGEYGMSLQQAMESVACIKDTVARSEVREILRSLIESTAPARSSDGASPVYVP